MEATKVGIREFRTDLAELISSGNPIAVTRHGQTVGYFIPTRSQDAAELEALRQASETLDTMLAKHKVAADDIIADYKKARRKGSR